ncbi:MAG: DNA polymerase IV [Sedimenticola sp.]|nr:DNA polymerase IV [Sedimenticola sp.]
MRTAAVKSQAFWPRVIILVDMNAFFCSVEQRDHPEWQGRPIGVTNGEQGTCIITSSYEARAMGIRTGMRVREARTLCPGFIQVPARPECYAEVSANIMDALGMVTPDIEVFSVDEAFLDVTRCQRLLGEPQQIAEQVKQAVFDASGGLLCSVGVSGDKTTAKYAAKLHKPDGLTVIPPSEAAQVLAPVSVTELCGIARGVGRFLAERGIHSCGQMKRLPIGELGRRFGNPGRRIWLMAQGLDPEQVKLSVPPPKSIGHGKVMPPETVNSETIRTYLLHMAEKVAARLRRHQFCAGNFFIGLRSYEGWLAGKYHAHPPTNHGADIMLLCGLFIQEHWQGQPVYQVQITALDPHLENSQQVLFSVDLSRRASLNAARDEINHCYGEFALAPARLLLRSKMPNVIAPAWKPFGHRETILNR